jgi:hypothetical protein
VPFDTGTLMSQARFIRFRSPTAHGREKGAYKNQRIPSMASPEHENYPLVLWQTAARVGPDIPH